MRGEQHREAMLSVIKRLQPMLLVIDWENREQCRENNEWLEKLIQVQNNGGKYLLLVRDPHDHPGELHHRGWEKWGPQGGDWEVVSNNELIIKTMREKDEEFDEMVVLGVLRAMVRDGRLRKGCIGSVSKSAGIGCSSGMTCREKSWMRKGSGRLGKKRWGSSASTASTLRFR